MADTPSLIEAAKALLERIDNITTDEFSKGGEHDAREALRLAIAAYEAGQARRAGKAGNA